MKKRMKMHGRQSRRDFSKKSGVHPRNNNNGNPMRGGIRL